MASKSDIQNQKFNVEMTMQELLQILPGAQRALFRLYHIGGCSSCGFRPDETLAEVCARNDQLDPNAVLKATIQECEEERKMLIEPKQLKQLLDEGESLQLVDIRSAEEFEAVHIEGAIPFTQDLMQTMLTQWPKENLLVLIDHQGLRGLDAAAYFAGHGFINVKALDGGIDAWSIQVDPSVPRYSIE